ncbi:hypothetical protein T06_1875 [Trichinella sp. T6]|nr:hypothetical protein T06_1875 [Trichinella sp. T6]
MADIDSVSLSQLLFCFAGFIMNYRRNEESDYQVQLNFTYCTYSGDVVCKGSLKEELTLIEFILEMEICHRSAFPKIKKLSSVVGIKEFLNLINQSS